MKSYGSFLFFLLLLDVMGFAQNSGLKGIIVERYYVADSMDASVALLPNLTEGATTYRIYVDMEPGYRFQAVFGSEGHPMKLATTTSFYNHPVHGNNLANLIYDAALPSSTVMLDSWISVGAASSVHVGVLKAHDDTVGNIKNVRGVLLNNDASCAPPLTAKDGLMRLPLGKEMPRVTALNIDTLLQALKNPSGIPTGFEFITTNGSWACIGGSSNESAHGNRVLIGQFTTTGVFSCILNVQLGKPGGGFEQHVFSNPSPGQFANKSLGFISR